MLEVWGQLEERGGPRYTDQVGQDSWHTQGLCLALLESDRSETALWCRAVECHQDNGSEVVFLIPSSLVRACEILRGQREWQTWSGVPTGDPDYDIITAESKVGLSNTSRCWSKSRGQVGAPFTTNRNCKRTLRPESPPPVAMLLVLKASLCAQISSGRKKKGEERGKKSWKTVLYAKVNGLRLR